jgi:hypothetical protein
VQVERVPCQLGVGAIEAVTPAHELDEQRNGTLDECMRVREQRLVICAGGTAARGEECAGSGTLAFGTGEEVCTRGREWTAVESERVAAVDVEAWMREWAEWWNGRGVGGRR